VQKYGALVLLRAMHPMWRWISDDDNVCFVVGMELQ
jgi:hypothetical protein